MDPIDISIYMCFFAALLLFINYIRRNIIKKAIKRRKNSERIKYMNELLNSCIGKMCDIYVYGEIGMSAKVLSVSDGWVCVEKKNGKRDLVNMDYISRIGIKEKG